MKNFYASMFISLMCALSAQAAVIQVTSDKSGTELQAAINAASSGDTLKVQAGTYYGNFTMKEGVNVIGGWNADFTDTTSYATILDANANGRVVNQPAAFDVLTVWENLTVQNGKLSVALSDAGGSGVALMAYGQVKHCLIQNNTFDYTSGNCIGGGVFNNAVGACTEPLVVDCWIRNNSGTHGGGARVAGIILNTVIEHNSTTNNAAGGVQLHYGGAMYNCIVRYNVSGGDMGGVRLTGTKACTVANCLIYGNEATKTIGGLSVETGVHYMYNNTIVCNKQKYTNNPNRAGVRLNVNSDAVFANNIVWGNMVNDDVQADQMEIHATYASDRAAAYFRNNAVVHPIVGTNTIVLDATNPGFVDASAGNFRLVYGSGLINAGEDDTQLTGAVDLDSNIRKAGPAVDMGAYEFPYHTLTIDAFEHATLLIGEDTIVAGAYELPQGHIDTVVIRVEEGYRVERVTCGDAILVEEEGVYALPALMADMTLTIEVEQIMYDLTVAEFEHATLILDGDTALAGIYPLPQGHIASAIIVAEEGYQIKSVTCGDAILEGVEGVYALPAMLTGMTLTIEVEQIMYDLTVAEFEHVTLILDGDTALAGTYPLPYGHIASAIIVAEEGYQIKSVTCGDALLVEEEGVYTLPAMLADMTLAIEVEESSTDIDNINVNANAVKVIRDGQLFILREGKEYNALGQKLHK